MCYCFVIWIHEMLVYEISILNFVFMKWLFLVALLTMLMLYICNIVYKKYYAWRYHLYTILAFNTHQNGMHVKECSARNSCDMVASISPMFFDFLPHMETFILSCQCCPWRDTCYRMCICLNFPFLTLIVYLYNYQWFT